MAERDPRGIEKDEMLDDGVLKAVDEARREMGALSSSDRFTVGLLTHFERLGMRASCRQMGTFSDTFTDESRP